MSRSKTVRSVLGELDAQAARRLAQSAGDLALVMDESGTIVEVLAPPRAAVESLARSWVGKSWSQTVTAESRQKVQALLRDALANIDVNQAEQAPRWRQINHPVQDGDDLPLLYTAISLRRTGADAQGAGPIVALARDLSESVVLQRRLIESQQAMERDYWRYREAETRYRHLFETTIEAVLIVDANSQKVVEANPAARQLCPARRSKPVGVPLASYFEPLFADRLQNMVAAARTATRQDTLRAQLVDGGAEVVLTASVFRQEDNTFVLVRLTPARTEPAAASGRRGGRAALSGDRAADASGAASESAVDSADAMLRAYVRQAPDGLVFCDEGGLVLSANAAFVSLVQLNAEQQLRGQSLDRWLGRTGVELGVLLATLRQRGSLGLFMTVLRGEFGAQIEVEISAAVLPMAEDTVLAFAVRDVDRRMRSEPRGGAVSMPRSASELAELVGRTPLKDIVGETSDVIEQLCIQTALQMTGDNRASAAQLLGLSRQSLYVKLRRYGLATAGTDED